MADNPNDFIVIILGGNLGAYSTARSFYEAFGVKSIILCSDITGSIKKSKIVEPLVVSDMMDEEVVLAELLKIESRYPIKKILLGSVERYVEMVIDLRDRLTDSWFVPFVSKEIFKKATTKRSFYEKCEEIGVAYPKTYVLSKKCEQLDLPFDFPIIIKPSDSVAYAHVSFSGKKKIFFCPTKEEAMKVIEKTFDSGYTSDLIIQEHIEGDNETIGVATCYRSFVDKEVKFVSFGNVLLGDPTPSAVGNHLAIIDTYSDQVWRDVEKLANAFDFCGFSNFDVKYNAKKDEYVFFELNGRLGRSNYFITGNGFNPAPYYVKDMLKEPIEVWGNAGHPVLYSVVPKSLLLKKITRNKIAVKQRIKTRDVVHPFRCKADNGFYRKLYCFISSMNYYKKFKNYKENDF